MKKITVTRPVNIFFFLLLLSIVNSGCSVYMAANLPAKKAIELFRPGTPRALLLAEFGAPAVSEKNDEGSKREVFVFEQGYSKGAKVARAIGHGVADVFTLGAWEIIGTPTEAAFDGKQMAFDVTYDDSENIKTATILQSK